MSSRTEICNIALGHFGTAKPLSDFETDESTAGVACRRYYEQALKQFLRAFPWPFAKRFRDLALVEQNPTDNWGYAYRYPSDCVMIRRIDSSLRNDSRQSRVTYEIASDNQGKLIYTNQENACVWYTKYTDTPSAYPEDFTFAFSYLIAWYVSPLLTKGDPFKIRQELLQAYKQAAAQAQANAFNEEQPDEDVKSDFERERDGNIYERDYQWWDR